MIIRKQKIRFGPDRAPLPKKVRIGFEGDNMVERLEFDLPEIAGMQSVTLMMGGKYANAVTLASDGEDYYVDLTADLVGAEGVIDAYVRIDGEGGEVWQSGMLRLVTGDVPDVETEIEQRFPTAVETMLTEMAGHKAEMEEQASRAEDAAKRAEEAAGNVAGSNVTSVNGQTGDVMLTAAAIGALDKESLGGAVDEALAQAKASGEFDGAPGPQGEKGETGAQGPQGDPGPAGENGLQGLQGPAGPQGEKGDQGDVGPQGPQGERGEKGETGDQGIQGPKGDPGDMGPVGPAGPQGESGIDGVSATHSWNGTVLTVTSASGTSSADLKGEKGDTGPAGSQGENGETPVRGVDYWTEEDQEAITEEVRNQLSLEKANNPLYGKKISLIGDSICAGADDGTSYLGGYGKIIADRNNMEYENFGKAGSTITAETYSSTNGGAKGWISRMVESMSSDADYAIAEGGINDAWQYSDHGTIEIGELSTGYNATLDDTTYYGAFESMLKQMVTKFQGKKIGYIAVPKMMSLYDSNRNAPNFYHIALECCAKWGVPVCDLNTIIPPTEYLKTLGTTYTADGTHPTYEGYLKYYCDPIEAWMKTLTTGGNVPTGASVSLTDLDDRYMRKSDVKIKKAQLTLEDGTTVLIDVVVASDGTTIQKYTNLVPTSINEDGSIYNDVGYKYGLRLSSTGVEKSQANSAICGYIPAKAGDVVRLGGFKWWNTGGTNYLCAYDSNFAFIGAVYGHAGLNYGTKIHSVVDYGEDVSTVTLNNVSNIAYIRANWAGGTSQINNENAGDIILTINEEIE